MIAYGHWTLELPKTESVNKYTRKDASFGGTSLSVAAFLRSSPYRRRPRVLDSRPRVLRDVSSQAGDHASDADGAVRSGPSLPELRPESSSDSLQDSSGLPVLRGRGFTFWASFIKRAINEDYIVGYVMLMVLGRSVLVMSYLLSFLSTGKVPIFKRIMDRKPERDLEGNSMKESALTRDSLDGKNVEEAKEAAGALLLNLGLEKSDVHAILNRTEVLEESNQLDSDADVPKEYGSDSGLAQERSGGQTEPDPSIVASSEDIPMYSRVTDDHINDLRGMLMVSDGASSLFGDSGRGGNSGGGHAGGGKSGDSDQPDDDGVNIMTHLQDWIPVALALSLIVPPPALEKFLSELVRFLRNSLLPDIPQPSSSFRWDPNVLGQHFIKPGLPARRSSRSSSMSGSSGPVTCQGIDTDVIDLVASMLYGAAHDSASATTELSAHWHDCVGLGGNRDAVNPWVLGQRLASLAANVGTPPAQMIASLRALAKLGKSPQELACRFAELESRLLQVEEDLDQVAVARLVQSASEHAAMRERNSLIDSLREQIAALEAQLSQEKERGAHAEQHGSDSSLVSERQVGSSAEMATIRKGELEVEVVHGECAVLHARIAELTQDHQEFGSKMELELLAVRREAEQQHAKHATRLSETLGERDELQRTLTAAAAEIEKRNEEFHALLLELESIQRSLCIPSHQTQAQLTAVRSQKEAADRELTDAHGQLMAKGSSVASAENERSVKDEALKSVLDELSKSRSQLDAVTSELEEARTNLAAKQSDLEALWHDYRLKTDAMQNMVAILEQKIADLDSSRLDKMMEMATIEADRNMLQDRVADLETADRQKTETLDRICCIVPGPAHTISEESGGQRSVLEAVDGLVCEMMQLKASLAQASHEQAASSTELSGTKREATDGAAGSSETQQHGAVVQPEHDSALMRLRQDRSTGAPQQSSAVDADNRQDPGAVHGQNFEDAGSLEVSCLPNVSSTVETQSIERGRRECVDDSASGKENTNDAGQDRSGSSGVELGVIEEKLSAACKEVAAKDDELKALRCELQFFGDQLFAKMVEVQDLVTINAEKQEQISSRDLEIMGLRQKVDSMFQEVTLLQGGPATAIEKDAQEKEHEHEALSRAAPTSLRAASAFGDLNRAQDAADSIETDFQSAASGSVKASPVESSLPIPGAYPAAADDSSREEQLFVQKAQGPAPAPPSDSPCGALLSQPEVTTQTEKLEQLATELSSVREKVASQDAALAALGEQYATSQQMVSSLRGDLALAEQRLFTQDASLNALKDESAAAKQHSAVQLEASAALERSLVAARAELSSQKQEKTSLDHRLHAAHEVVAVQRKELAEVGHALAEAQKCSASLQRDMQDRGRVLGVAQQAAAEAHVKAGVLESQVKVFDEQLRGKELVLSDALAEVARQQQKAQELEEAILVQADEVQQLRVASDERNAALAESVRAAEEDMKQKERQLAEASASIRQRGNEHQVKISEARKSLTGLEKQLEARDIHVANLKSELTKARDQVQFEAAELAAARARAARLEDELKMKQQALTEAQACVQATEEVARQKEEELSAVRMEVVQLQGKVQTLQDERHGLLRRVEELAAAEARAEQEVQRANRARALARDCRAAMQAAEAHKAADRAHVADARLRARKAEAALEEEAVRRVVGIAVAKAGLQAHIDGLEQQLKQLTTGFGALVDQAGPPHFSVFDSGLYSTPARENSEKVEEWSSPASPTHSGQASLLATPQPRKSFQSMGSRLDQMQQQMMQLQRELQVGAQNLETARNVPSRFNISDFTQHQEEENRRQSGMSFVPNLPVLFSIARSHSTVSPSVAPIISQQDPLAPTPPRTSLQTGHRFSNAGDMQRASPLLSYEKPLEDRMQQLHRRVQLLQRMLTEAEEPVVDHDMQHTQGHRGSSASGLNAGNPVVPPLKLSELTLYRNPTSESELPSNQEASAVASRAISPNAGSASPTLDFFVPSSSSTHTPGPTAGHAMASPSTKGKDEATPSSHLGHQKNELDGEQGVKCGSLGMEDTVPAPAETLGQMQRGDSKTFQSARSASELGMGQSVSNQQMPQTEDSYAERQERLLPLPPQSPEPPSLTTHGRSKSSGSSLAEMARSIQPRGFSPNVPPQGLHRTKNVNMEATAGDDKLGSSHASELSTIIPEAHGLGLQRPSVPGGRTVTRTGSMQSACESMPGSAFLYGDQFNPDDYIDNPMANFEEMYTNPLHSMGSTVARSSVVQQRMSTMIAPAGAGSATGARHGAGGFIDNHPATKARTRSVLVTGTSAAHHAPPESSSSLRALPRPPVHSTTRGSAPTNVDEVQALLRQHSLQRQRRADRRVSQLKNLDEGKCLNWKNGPDDEEVEDREEGGMDEFQRDGGAEEISPKGPLAKWAESGDEEGEDEAPAEVASERAAGVKGSDDEAGISAEITVDETEDRVLDGLGPSHNNIVPVMQSADAHLATSPSVEHRGSMEHAPPLQQRPLAPAEARAAKPSSASLDVRLPDPTFPLPIVTRDREKSFSSVPSSPQAAPARPRERGEHSSKSKGQGLSALLRGYGHSISNASRSFSIRRSIGSHPIEDGASPHTGSSLVNAEVEHGVGQDRGVVIDAPEPSSGHRMKIASLSEKLGRKLEHVLGKRSKSSKIEGPRTESTSSS